ncbi:MAG: methionine synthase [Acidobacteriota bacterium]
MTTATRIEALKDALTRRILVLDGATGTALQARDLSAADFGGELYEGCNEHLVLTRPDVIREVHDAYLAAGADIIETDTFGGTPLVLAEYGLAAQAETISATAARLAREAAEAASTPEKPRWVAGSMGPTTKAISVTGGITFDELRATFRVQARGLLAGGADYLLIETCQDTRNIKAAILGAHEAFDEAGQSLPLAVSGTIEPMGTMLAGQNVEALNTSLQHVDLLYIGLNCATGPAFMADHIRALAGLAKVPVACVPNAGLPDEDGRYLETPAMLAAALARFVDLGWINLVGGCCGTTPAHVRELVKVAADRPPRRPAGYTRTFVSGIENLELEESNRPVLVGERTNVIGSRRFRDLIGAGKFEEGAEIARRQVKNGAQIVDVCLADPDADERGNIERFLDRLIRVVKVPLMIDSTDVAVIRAALPWCQGKTVINSINLEDGEARFEGLVPLGRAYGAAFVVGCIDEDPEQGMAVTRERKLEVALRSHELLTTRYGVATEDILFDPLVFPCGTGDANYVGSARETIEGVRLIKEHLPAAKTILGISNVSFGLPPAGREILNSVFLYHCTRAGLDAAIVNSERLERYASIAATERELSEAILFADSAGESDRAIAAFTAHFRQAKARGPKKPTRQRPLDERLAAYILEGTKEGLLADLDEAVATRAPLDVINGPLMAGMAEVGRLFNNNELIVAEVLQSAEAMKAAVAHLEPLMESTDSARRGRVILATVKGDVHDIGKNLVEIILGNNGFEVINLGIKVPPRTLIEAIAEREPDMVGLSGLLVKSAQQMVVTAEELAAAGCTLPILVGGAALTRSFTRRRIAAVYPGPVIYATDAMNGLAIAGRLMDPEQRPSLEAELEAEATRFTEPAGSGAPPCPAPAPGAGVARLDRLPAAPDLDRHVLPTINLDEAWKLMNPALLFGKHLGLKGNFARLLDDHDEKAVFLARLIDDLKKACRAGAMQAAGIYRFFPCEPDGDTLHLFSADGREPEASITFPRQTAGKRLCLTDYVSPPAAGGRRDTICLMATTAGCGIRERVERHKEAGEYLASHALASLAVETAEGAMEWLHRQVRALWGLADPADLTPQDLFKTRYRGRRYSFGYPACPDLDGQEILFRLLAPADIGITLTDGQMMDPEASVTALAFHHPDATYFAV